MTIFYKLRHATDDNLECYVGSTDNLANRKSEHKHHCNNLNSDAYNIKIYHYIRANGGFANWLFEVLAEVEGLTKIEKLRMERELTELHGATLNVHKAGALLEAGRKEYKRQHYRQHIEEFKEYDRQRNNNDNLCDRCGAIYRGKSNKTSHQRTQKCQRAQPIIVNGGVVNIHIHN